MLELEESHHVKWLSLASIPLLPLYTLVVIHMLFLLLFLFIRKQKYLVAGPKTAVLHVFS